MNNRNVKDVAFFSEIFVSQIKDEIKMKYYILLLQIFV